MKKVDSYKNHLNQTKSVVFYYGNYDDGVRRGLAHKNWKKRRKFARLSKTASRKIGSTARYGASKKLFNIENIVAIKT